MKKLMIVAAVATMAGALVAADGYDFTASVKTTTGKAGAQKTTYTVNCGLDDNGVYWWDALGFASDAEAKQALKGMNNEEKADFAWNYLGFDGKDTAFPNQEWYRNRWRWCYTFRFTENNSDCYRVACSRKIKGIVYIDGCCDDSGSPVVWEYVAGDDIVFADADTDWDGYITPGVLYRFGGVSLDKANKIEMAGVAGTTAFDGNQADAGNFNTFALAGQGAYDVKNDYIKNISGNIVGVLENPDCESCCDYNKDACFFACDGLHSEKDYTITGNEGTAAFGTWSIKYNKRY